MTQEIALEYEPREHFIPFHQRPQRWSCLVVHRRGGKTVACINDTVARALYTKKKDARFAYVAPFYRQAKDIAWVYLKNYAQGAITKIRESELRVELVNGAWVTLYGADNPDSLRGIYLDGVILDEYGDCRPSLWGEVIFPTLTDRKGWCVFIGTPKGKNHFYKIFRKSQTEDGWYNLHLPVYDTNVFNEQEIAEIKTLMDKEEFEQEYECSFEAAVKGTYFADLLNAMPDDRFSENNSMRLNVPVNIATDLGMSDSTAIWFWQNTESGPLLIDYYENHGKTLEHYFDILEAKNYTYGEMWLPHDGKADNFQTGRTTFEQFLKHFHATSNPDERGGGQIYCDIVPRVRRKQDSINAARMILPKCSFCMPSTFSGVEALRAYKRKYNEITRAFSETPEHTWASDGADAFQQFAMVAKETYGHEEVKPKTVEEQIEEMLAKRPTLDDLWEERDRVLNLARNRI